MRDHGRRGSGASIGSPALAPDADRVDREQRRRNGSAAPRPAARSRASRRPRGGDGSALVTRSWRAGRKSRSRSQAIIHAASGGGATARCCGCWRGEPGAACLSPRRIREARFSRVRPHERPAGAAARRSPGAAAAERLRLLSASRRRRFRRAGPPPWWRALPSHWPGPLPRAQAPGPRRQAWTALLAERATSRRASGRGSSVDVVLGEARFVDLLCIHRICTGVRSGTTGCSCCSRCLLLCGRRTRVGGAFILVIAFLRFRVERQWARDITHCDSRSRIGRGPAGVRQPCSTARVATAGVLAALRRLATLGIRAAGCSQLSRVTIGGLRRPRSSPVSGWATVRSRPSGPSPTIPRVPCG